jgi:putative FmdB family regulatory protein
MPTYEYECKSCSHGFEAFQAMSEQPLKECPQCGKEVHRLILGGAGVIFKGSGFYVTDKGKTDSSQKSAQKSESSPAAQSCGSCEASKQCPVAASSGTEQKTA